MASGRRWPSPATVERGRPGRSDYHTQGRAFDDEVAGPAEVREKVVVAGGDARTGNEMGRQFEGM